ncbi:MAG: hypothetical protein QGI21_00790 [Candidatus Poseidoniaceae archaeon]|nr:hypothetical protein [Candidatus Poseidoniaceae archaeon]
MPAKQYLVVAVLAMMCLAPFQSVEIESLESDSGNKMGPGGGPGQGPADILLMGNSYISSNSLESLLGGVMSSASNQANVSSLTSGGMRLSQHASNVASSGHQWNNTLNNGDWDWVVLQDQSQVPGFPRSQQEWIASKDGAVQLAEIIEDNDGETILMMTWGRRSGDSNNAWRFPDFSTMQDELASGYLDYRDNITANGDTVWVAPVGLAFEHIHDNVLADGDDPTSSGNLFYDLYSSDGSHPSLAGSYLAACVLYATITGNNPVGLSHATSLSNSVVLELQQAAAATVFNGTNNLDYPWQSMNNQGGSNPNLTIRDSQLGFEWVNGKPHWDGEFIFENVLTLNNGDLLLSSVFEDHDPIYQYRNCTSSSYNNNSITIIFAILHLRQNGDCIDNLEIKDISTNKSQSMGISRLRSMVSDNQNNIYISGSISTYDSTLITTRTIQFGDEINFTINSEIGFKGVGFVAKINSSGDFEWVKNGGNSASHEFMSMDFDNNGNLVVVGNQYGDNLSFGQHSVIKYDYNGVFVASISPSGIWRWASKGGSDWKSVMAWDLDTDSNGNTVITGQYWLVDSNITGVSFGNYELPSGNSVPGMYLAKIDNNGIWKWAKAFNSTVWSVGKTISIDSNSDIYVSGEFYSDSVGNSTMISAGGSQNGFVAKFDSNGNWTWVKHIDCSCEIAMSSSIIDLNDNLLLGGNYNGVIQLDSLRQPVVVGQVDIFVAKINSSGVWKHSFGFGTTEEFDHLFPGGMSMDYSGNLYLTGYLGQDDGMVSKFGIIEKTNYHWYLAKLSSDYDGDMSPDSIDDDDDNDFINDNSDLCQYSPIGFQSFAALDHDSDGCRDSDEDDDDDGDTLNDTIDQCPKGNTNWVSNNLTDFDSDGCMDALEDYDDDGDGFQDFEDYCPREIGNSTFDYEKGCPDSDGDGRADILDPFEDDPDEWADTDGDEVGDNSDAFPLDATQKYDTDEDGYGDEEFGNNGDSCPLIPGNSTIDRKGCPDSDGDGWSDDGDDFPYDPSEYLDSDNDGFPDDIDAFPYDPTQWEDSDGDGYGDNSGGSLADAYPNDPSRYADSDRDGIDDQADAFPYDPTQWEDSDGDGMGDNPMGIGADKFPDDPTQWGDIDGDGYGDNSTGNNPDAFPNDATQWSDRDGDGYGDNLAGRLYDMFPDNPTQWIDDDGDGLGDNQSGTNADPYLNDFDNDGYNDTIDILPRLSSPGDLDNDGCMDEEDEFKDNSLECIDTDGDGIGNNADADDDNDLVTDADEIRAGTDPLDPYDTPVDSFEIQIGNIGLGAWDLIGMFGGIPIFSWLLFGFATRNSRCARYEGELEKANSRQELEKVALRWEYSLMLRLLGPHQGIRLERLRSELDDKFEYAENMLLSEDSEPITDIDQTPLVEAEDKEIPEIGSAPPIDSIPDQIDENGYSWLKYNNLQWYRTNDESEWYHFEG